MVSPVNYAANNPFLSPAVKSAASGYQANSAAANASSANDSVDATSGSGGGLSTYDFTNVTPNQLKDIGDSLFKSGQINSKQWVQMGISSASALLGKIDANGHVTMRSTAEAAQYLNTPVNYIKNLQDNLAYLQQSGHANDTNYADEQKLLSTLQGLQGQTSSVNITV